MCHLSNKVEKKTLADPIGRVHEIVY